MPILFRNYIESDDKIEYRNSLFLKVRTEHLNVTKMLWLCPIFFQNKISLTLTFLCQMLHFWRIAIFWQKKLSNSCFFFKKEKTLMKKAYLTCNLIVFPAVRSPLNLFNHYAFLLLLFGFWQCQNMGNCLSVVKQSGVRLEQPLQSRMGLRSPQKLALADKVEEVSTAQNELHKVLAYLSGHYCRLKKPQREDLVYKVDGR